MRLILLPLAPLLVAAAVAPKTPVTSHAPGKLAAQPEQFGKNCHGRIEETREERGLPKLAPDKAGSAEPLLILAVDRQIDGCEVLVLRNDINDIRPVPEFSDTARMRPAH
jgi:hypothetical protein